MLLNLESYSYNALCSPGADPSEEMIKAFSIKRETDDSRKEKVSQSGKFFIFCCILFELKTPGTLSENRCNPI